MVPDLRDAAEDVDLAVASRYGGDGDSSGLSSGYRRWVSSGSTRHRPGVLPAPGRPGVHRPDDRLLLLPPLRGGHGPAAPPRLQDPARDPRPARPARPRAAVHLRRPAGRREQGLVAQRRPVPVPDGEPADGPDEPVRGRRRSSARSSTWRSWRCSSRGRRAQLRRRRRGRRRGVDPAQLPDAGAVRLPGPAGRRAPPGAAAGPAPGRSTTPRRCSDCRSSSSWWRPCTSTHCSRRA